MTGLEKLMRPDDEKIKKFIRRAVISYGAKNACPDCYGFTENRDDGDCVECWTKALDEEVVE